MTADWNNIVTEAIKIRHDLHANPELGWQEDRTAEKIRCLLKKWQIPFRSCAGTGTVAVLNSDSLSSKGKGLKHIALRADIDALPIIEKTQKEYQSNTEGCMHACGHDGHLATLLATAQWLKIHEHELPRPVTLLFQPAEEGGHGAKKMIEDGALENVDEIFGWHNWPALPFGTMACPNGIVMCGNGTFRITVTGVGGHASQPELCADPVLAASAIVMALQQIVARRIAPQQTAVVSVTSINASSGPTTIPENALIGGSIRVPNESIRNKVNALITEISHQVAASYGVACSVEIEPRYQATVNHVHQAEKMRNAWIQQWGPDALNHGINLPIMASEDFSYYLNEIPGAFALVGADDGEAHQAPCHSPYYDFNDKLIEKVGRIFIRLAGVHQPDPSNQQRIGDHL